MKLQKIIDYISKENLLTILFFIQLFLWRIPNVYLFPPIPNAFLTTQSLARIIIVILFIIHAIVNKSSHLKKHKSIFIFVSLFLLFQSLSIFSAITIESFIRRYKDVLIGIVSFFVFYHNRGRLFSIAKLFIISSVISLTYQCILFFLNSEGLLMWFGKFIYSEHWIVVTSKIYDGKIYSETFDEINVPIFLHLLSLSPFGFLNGTLASITALISFLSNIRSRIVMMFIDISGYVLLIKKSRFTTTMQYGLFAVILVFLADSLTFHFVNYSFLDRITLQDDLQDVQTITGRFEQLENSLDMGETSLFGVGLGNYFDNLPQKNKNEYPTSNWQTPTIIGGTEYVHNFFGTIIAETGFISVAVFIIILVLTAKNDASTMKNGTSLEKAFVISFWSLFSYGLLNPPVPGAYQVLFWGLRGLTLR